MKIADSATIHPTALIEDGAIIGEGATIGPFCTIGADAVIGAGTRLISHVVVAGVTRIGEDNRVFPFTALGTVPQDLKYAGERTELHIGSRNTIRENVTMNPGTVTGTSVTRVGDDNLFMVGCHVAHDCIVGNHAIFANNATIAGHVEVGDFAILGGISAVHQFVRIGAHAMVGGMTGVERDVIPFGSVMGNRAHLAGLNLLGMKRRNFDREQIHTLRAAFRELFTGEEGALIERASALRESAPAAGPARDMLDFILAGSERRFCVPQA